MTHSRLHDKSFATGWKENHQKDNLPHFTVARLLQSPTMPGLTKQDSLSSAAVSHTTHWTFSGHSSQQGQLEPCHTDEEEWFTRWPFHTRVNMADTPHSLNAIFCSSPMSISEMDAQYTTKQLLSTTDINSPPTWSSSLSLSHSGWKSRRQSSLIFTEHSKQGKAWWVRLTC